MIQKNEGVWSLRLQNRLDAVALRQELKGRVALFVTAAGVALGAAASIDSWAGLAPGAAAAFFLWKMLRAQRRLRMLENEAEFW